MKDKYAPLRRSTINKLGTSKFKDDVKVIEAIEQIANTEKSRKTKAAAISFLAKKGDQKIVAVTAPAPIQHDHKALFEKNISDSSYSVAGAALEGLQNLEPAKAYELAKVALPPTFSWLNGILS